jgi:hypothetical protein
VITLTGRGIRFAFNCSTAVCDHEGQALKSTGSTLANETKAELLLLLWIHQPMTDRLQCVPSVASLRPSQVFLEQPEMSSYMDTYFLRFVF